MRRVGRFIKLTIVIGLLFFASNYFYTHYSKRQPTPPGFYYVSYVYDGDTVEVDMNGTAEKVRMIGVDTPETHKPNTPVQCYGPEASDYSKAHLTHKNIRLESDEINQDRDKYGRLLRYIYLQDDTLWNAELVKLGYGRALTAFPFTKVTEFEAYEKEAKESSRGLWASCR